MKKRKAIITLAMAPYRVSSHMYTCSQQPGDRPGHCGEAEATEAAMTSGKRWTK